MFEHKRIRDGNLPANALVHSSNVGLVDCVREGGGRREEGEEWGVREVGEESLRAHVRKSSKAD